MWVGGEEILDPTQQFEKGRIRTLQEERIRVQQKTFTKWINHHINPTGLQVNDLFKDITNGKVLHRLLEVISGERLPKISRGIMRIQQLENVGICLSFVSSKVQLENIGASDIVDGNQRLILGLIWTIILRFQIQQMVFEQEEEDSVKRSAKESLLLWCQRITEPYKGTDVRNFDKSWQDGMAFNAMIHSKRPELVDYDSLDPKNGERNLKNAFDIFEREMNIPKLLDAEDVHVRPDEKSLMTYIAQIYSTYAKMRNEARSERRIEKVLRTLKDIDAMEQKYNGMMTDLLAWIAMKTNDLNNRTFPNSLDGIRRHLAKFNSYRNEEKPPKYKEKGELHFLFHSITVKCFANNRIPFFPKEGHLLKNIEDEWDKMDKAERRKETAIVKEYMRLDALERLAERFRRKNHLRKAWLQDMWEIVEDQEAEAPNMTVMVAFQRNEAIVLDVDAREEKFKALKDISKQLWKSNYNNKEELNQAEKTTRAEYDELRERLRQNHVIYQGAKDAASLVRETALVRQEIKEIEPALLSQDYGKHLMMVEALLQRHSLVEGQVLALDKRIANMGLKVQNVVVAKHPDSEKTLKGYNELKRNFDFLKDLSQKRRARLEQSLEFHQFLQEADEEEMWLDEHIEISSAPVVAKDLLSVMSLQKKQKAFEQEVKSHKAIIADIREKGQQLLDAGVFPKAEILPRMEVLPEKHNTLTMIVGDRLERLQEALETQQYYTDANDAESWMKEKMPLVSSEDVGNDSRSAEFLYQSHVKLNDEIGSFSAADINKLAEEANRLKRTELALQPSAGGVESGVTDEFIEEVVDVPYEVEERQMISRQVTQADRQKKEIKRVEVTRRHEAAGSKLKVGQVYDLQDDTDEIFWVIKSSAGEEFVVPRAILKPAPSKFVETEIAKNQTVQEEVTVKRIQKRSEKVKRRKTLKTGIHPISGASKKSSRFDSENIQLRQQTLKSMYDRITTLSEARLRLLDDSVRFHTILAEINELDSWMTEKDRFIHAELARRKTVGPDVLRQTLETYLTQLAANESRVARVNQQGEEFVTTGHSKQDVILKRLKQLNAKWEEMKKLKLEKENILAGAAGLAAFEDDAEELIELAKEKLLQNEADPNLLRHKQTPADLQKQINDLNRQMAPLDEKIQKLIVLGNSLAATNPREAAKIRQKVAELEELRDQLQEEAKRKQRALEQERDLCQFKQDCQHQIDWSDKVRAQMAQKPENMDLTSATKALEDHELLKDDIDIHIPQIKDLISTGAEQSQLHPKDQQLQQLVHQINRLPAKLNKEWDLANRHLTENKLAAQFFREADRINAESSGHLALLDLKDLGSSVDETEALIRKQEDMLDKLKVQDEKVNALKAFAAKLKKDRNYASPKIEEKLKEVIDLRNKVWDDAQDRLDALNESLAYHTLLRDVNEMDEWMQDKLVLAQSPEFKQLNNIDKKQQKIASLEAELETRYADLNALAKKGKEMIAEDHYRSPEIKAALLGLAKTWSTLKAAVENASATIGQAHQQKQLNDDIESRMERLGELEDIINNDFLGVDANDAKRLLKEQEEVDEELCNCVKDPRLQKQADAIIKNGHFDPDGVQETVSIYKNAVKQLQGPAEAKGQKLKDAIEFFQWKEDALAQREWINERFDSATSTFLGTHLDTTNQLHSKHTALEKELTNNEPVLEELLMRGQKMIMADHFAKTQIQDLGSEITELWNEINKASEERMKALEDLLTYQKLVLALEEAMEWLGEKRAEAQSRLSTVSSDPDKLDEKKISTALTKHKDVETAVNAYFGDLEKLDDRCCRLVESGHNMSNDIEAKQDELGEYLESVSGELKKGREFLETCQLALDFQAESQDLLEWCVKAATQAQSPDYGRDFDDFQRVDDNFTKLKESFTAHSEQLRECEKIAQAIKRKSPGEEFAWVDEKLKDLKEMVRGVKDMIDDREELMDSARELHQFNKDVFESMSLVNDKLNSIPDAVGSDLQTVQALLRKQEAFETDLVALEAQLLQLVEDADRLAAEYPGENEEGLAEGKQQLIASWQTLRQATTDRRKTLQLNLELQKYKASARDLLDWLEEQQEVVSEARLSAFDPKSIKAAQDTLAHVGAEMRAKEDDFSTLVERGDRMVTGEHAHPNTHEIDQLSSTVLDKKGALEDRVEKVQEELKALSQLKDFENRCNKLKELLNNELHVIDARNSREISENALRSCVREHDALEAKVSKEESILTDLKSFVNEMSLINHPQLKKMNKSVEELTALKQTVNSKCKARRALLDATKLFFDFKLKATEEEIWLNEKLVLAQNDAYKRAKSFDEKIKVLRKHQALETEVEGGKGRFAQLKKEAAETVFGSPYKKETDRIMAELERLWKKLQAAMDNKSQVLSEAREVVTFFNECDTGERWMKDQENLIRVGDLGDDFEHCQHLLDKLNAASPDALDEEKLQELNRHAQALASKGQLDPAAVKQRQQELNKKFKELAEAKAAYQQQLERALEVHKFVRDCSEVCDLIKEKTGVARSDELGDTLDFSEKLLHRLDLIASTLPDLRNRVKNLKEGAALESRHPDKRDVIRGACEDLDSEWSEMQSAMTHRHAALENAVNLHRLFRECKIEKEWAKKTAQEMDNVLPAKSAKEAMSKQAAHQDLLVEINNHEGVVDNLTETAEKLKKANPDKKQEVEDAIQELQREFKKLHNDWEDQKKIREDDISLQNYLKARADCEQKLANQELLFTSSDCGDSVASVQQLEQKNNLQMKALKDQINRASMVIASGNDLISQGHHSKPFIQQKNDELKSKIDSVNSAADQRQKQLALAKDVQLFLQKAREAIVWSIDQDKKALDESYKDATNLMHKIERHAAFEANIRSQGTRVDELETEGSALLDRPGAQVWREDIESKLEELKEEFAALKNHSDLKKRRLREALQTVEFNKSAEKMDQWAEEAEKEVESPDHGNDLASVKKLLKKHEKTEEELSKKCELVDSLEDTVNSFKQAQHFMAASMEERMNGIVSRYDALSRAVKIREDNLKASLAVHTFVKKVQGHIMWLKEKLEETESVDEEACNSLGGAESLLAASEALEKEAAAKEELKKTLGIECNTLVNRHSSYSSILRSFSHQFNDLLARLQSESAQRTKQLKLIVIALKIMNRLSESESWIREKKRLVTADPRGRADMGGDEDSCQALLDRLEQARQDVDRYRTVINETEMDVDDLVNKQHFKTPDRVTDRLEEVQNAYEELLALFNKRSSALQASLNVFRFMSTADDVLAELEDCKEIARLDDYGHDLESVDALISDFRSSEKDADDLKEKSENLVSQGNNLSTTAPFMSSEIQQRVSALKVSCRELDMLRDARQAALDGARMVHRFDNDVDECKLSIFEKQAELTNEHEMDDFESLQLLYDKQSNMEREIDAIQEQVKELEDRGKQLADDFGNEPHVKDKLEELRADWGKLAALKSSQAGKLKDLEQIEDFYNRYRELMSWINETIGVMNFEDLPRDVPNADSLVKQHESLKHTIEGREPDVRSLAQLAEKLINKGVSVQEDINAKNCKVSDGYETVKSTWSQRYDLYRINLDLQEYLADADNLETWIKQRQPEVSSTHVGETLIDVEDLMKRHAELEVLIEAQKEKLNLIQRKTKLETGLSEWREKEEHRMRDEERKKVQAGIRKKETMRIQDEKQKRKERRRTQEITMSPEKMIPVVPAKRQISDPRHFAEPHLVSPVPSTDLDAAAAAAAAHQFQTPDPAAGDRSSVSSQPGTPARSGSGASRTKPQNEQQVARDALAKTEEKQQAMKRTFGNHRRRTMEGEDFQETMQAVRKISRESLPPPPEAPTQEDSNPAPVIRGFLDRKPVFQAGGKKPTLRHWKTLFSVVLRHFILFYKDEHSFTMGDPPVNSFPLARSKCEVASDYAKRKNALRLMLADNSEFLLVCANAQEMQDWLNVLNSQASSAPANAASLRGSQLGDISEAYGSTNSISSGSGENTGGPVAPPRPSATLNYSASRGSQNLDANVNLGSPTLPRTESNASEKTGHHRSGLSRMFGSSRKK